MPPWGSAHQSFHGVTVLLFTPLITTYTEKFVEYAQRSLALSLPDPSAYLVIGPLLPVVE